MHRAPHLMTLLASAAVLALATGTAQAADYDVAGGKLRFKGSVFAGAVYRTDSTNPEIVQTANAATVGITTPVATGGANQDDGNLNYRKGDTVSRAISIPRLASASARSFSTCPAWPLTQHHSILLPLASASICFHKSTFLTGFLSAVCQPRHF